MKKIYPKLNNNLRTQDLGDEMMVYDVEKENLHILNITACAIWRLCDGKHTIDDIEEYLLNKFSNIPKSEINNDVIITLYELKKNKLII